MTRAFVLGCLLALVVGALAQPAEEKADTKVETQGKADAHPLKSYLDRIKQSSFKPDGPLTEGKKVSGGTSSQTLDRIRQMVSRTEQRHKGHHLGHTFPHSVGNPGSNLFDFGKLSLGHPGAHEKIRRQNYGGPGPYVPNPMAGQSYGSGSPYLPPSGGNLYPAGGYGSGAAPTYGGGSSYPSGGSYSYPGEGLPSIDYSDVHPLSLYDYEHIWVQMLQEIYRILKDKDLLEDKHLASKVLDHLFKMLNDIKTLSKHTVDDDPTCPRIYHRSGDLCLSVDFITSFLDYNEARLYCQVVKGGDLVMFRDANEFADIQEFVHKIDPQRDFSYWIGLKESDNSQDNDWRFIDGRSAEYGAPYWGVNIREINDDLGPNPHLRGTNGTVVPNAIPRKTSKRKGPGGRRNANKNRRRPRVTESRQITRLVNSEESNFDADQKFELEPGHDHEPPPPGSSPGPPYHHHHHDEDYALLFNDDFHYIHAVDFKDAEEYNAIPLCQYIPERDQTNFQYGEAIWEDWNDYNDWKGWTADSKEAYVEQPPHSHYKPYRPQKGKPMRPPYSYGSGDSNYGGGGNPYGGSGGTPYGGSGGTPYGGSGGTPYGGSGGTPYGGGGGNPYGGSSGGGGGNPYGGSSGGNPYMGGGTPTYSGGGQGPYASARQNEKPEESKPQ